MPRTDVEIRTLIEATDVDVLPDTSVVEDRGEYVVVRTPTNPSFHWGNFLMFRRPPAAGDGPAWEAAFEREFGSAGARESRHVSLCWDVCEDGAARSEFLDRGYEHDLAVALVAEPRELVDHPRANGEVETRVLAHDGDDDLWAQVLDLQVAAREPGHGEAEYRRFVEARMADRRVRFAAGDGAWVVALDDGVVVGSCGVVVTHGRCRFQAVDTAESHRRRGIARRVVGAAGRLANERFGAERLVIVADAEYHAKALYESLGFVERERKLAVCWWPGAANAGRHPTFAPAGR